MLQVTIRYLINQKIVLYLFEEIKTCYFTDLYDDVLYCIITDDHLIPVGEYTFWDWED